MTSETEKNLSTLSAEEQSGTTSPSDAPSDVFIDWTPQEEKQVVRKLDTIVMPLLVLGFSALQFDRGNIGNTLTDHFLKDVGITQFQYNIGQQLLSVGIVVLEIPSNLVLYRIGPPVWISAQIFCWSLVATFQAFQKGLGAYLVTRLFLGFCESGFIPAGLFTITLWYTKTETAKRFSVFFLGNMVAQALSGIVAYGVLHMRGIAGLTGWQWLFILEGLYGFLIVILFVSLFPGLPSKPVTVFGVSLFTERERHIIYNRIIAADGSNARIQKSITFKDVTSTLGDWTVYPHLFLTLAALAPSSTMWSYAPTLLISFGYPRLQSNALVSVGCWILIVTNIFSGYVADKINRRGIVVLTGLIIYFAFMIGNLVLATSTSKPSRYAILTLSLAFSSCWHPTNGAWLAANATTPASRSIRMAMFIMSANMSGIIGSQLFQASDSPRYLTGWSAIVGLIAAAIVFGGVALGQYWLINRRLERKVGGEGKKGYGY